MTEKKERTLFSKILLFAGILGIPAFFIFFFALGTQRYEPILYHGDHKLDQNGDTVAYYVVPPFTFYDHNGEAVTEKDFENKYVVVNYIFRDCPNADVEKCPLDFKGFVKMYIIDQLVNNKKFGEVKVLSYFDADQDTLLEMNEFIQDHNIDTDSWKIVTGDMGQITTQPSMDPILGQHQIRNMDLIEKLK